MIDTTWAGIRCSSSWATARAKPAAWSWVWGRLRGTYSCSPLLPDVFAQAARPTASRTSRMCSATRQHSMIVAGLPGSRSNTTMVGASMSPQRAMGAWISSAARLADQARAATESSRQ